MKDITKIKKDLAILTDILKDADDLISDKSRRMLKYEIYKLKERINNSQLIS